MEKQTQMILDAFTKEEIREIRIALEIRSDTQHGDFSSDLQKVGRNEHCESALDAIMDATTALRQTSKKNS
jgi:hypothetical protein